MVEGLVRVPANEAGGVCGDRAETLNAVRSQRTSIRFVRRLSKSSRSRARRHVAPQQRLYLRPEPNGHASLRPALRPQQSPSHLAQLRSGQRPGRQYSASVLIGVQVRCRSARHPIVLATLQEVSKMHLAEL